MRHSQLKAFHNVARLGGFSRAAEAMTLSQPAVSEQVGRLERDHDVLLFRRDGRRVVLTDAGEQLFRLTREYFDVEDRIVDCLSEARASPAGTLRLVVDAAQHILPLLARFRAAHPKVTLEIRTGNTDHVLSELRAFRADIGVVGGEAKAADLTEITLGEAPIVAVAAPAFWTALGDRAPLGDIARRPLILREPGSRTRASLEAAARDTNTKLTPAIVAEGREAVRDLAAAGLGVGFVSAAEFRADARLKIIQISDVAATMPERLVYLRQRADVRAIGAFLALARD